MDGDCAKARRNDLSLGCGHREVSSVLFGDYFDDGSSQCHGSARCTASGEFDSCSECMIFCLTVPLSRVIVKTCLYLLVLSPDFL